MVAEREKQVKEIYEGVEFDRTRELLKKYEIRFIVLGNKERQSYRVNEEKLLNLGEVVVDREEVRLIKVY